MPASTPSVVPSATSSSALQKTSAAMAGTESTAAHLRPNLASNGSTSVVNPNDRMRLAKNKPPRIRLMPNERPPCRPSARLDL